MKKVVLGSLLIASSLLASNAVYDGQCASCHGAKGNESLAGNPKITGLSEAKVADMLKGYKSGKLKGDTMTGIVAGLSDADIANVSKYVSTLK